MGFTDELKSAKKVSYKFKPSIADDIICVEEIHVKNGFMILDILFLTHDGYLETFSMSMELAQEIGFINFDALLKLK